MKFETITLKDIARALNLSVSTVSKALRNSHEISTDTRKLVTDFAEQHNYKPNPIAQGLRKGKSKTIGIIVSNIDNNFFSQVINSAESVAYKKGYNVVIAQTHESYEREVLAVQHLSSGLIDGLIVSLSAETHNTGHFAEPGNKGLPLVFFDRVANEWETHKVTCNNFKGAYDATAHLLQQGFRNIGHITSSNSLSITHERLEGYLKALEDHAMKPDKNLVKYCMHGGMIYEETHTAITELLTAKKKPDAILTASDRLSTTTMSILTQLKIKIPGEIGLVGFTNSISADIFNPSLTAVVQPAFEIGRHATEMLVQLVEAKKPVTKFESRVLDTALVIRQSSISLKK